jgi:hypothetical protein
MSDWRKFISVTEVDDGGAYAGALFRRKFNAAPPDVPHHIVTFYQRTGAAPLLLSYVHFREFGELMLVGGACTDGAVIRGMDESERAALAAAGGAYLQALRFAFARFAPRCEAFFGYCGDARARGVDLQAGFLDAGHQHLLVNFHKPLGEARQRELIARVHAIGPF